MDSIPWEKAKLYEFGKNRFAMEKPSGHFGHPDKGLVPLKRYKRRLTCNYVSLILLSV